MRKRIREKVRSISITKALHYNSIHQNTHAFLFHIRREEIHKEEKNEKSVQKITYINKKIGTQTQSPKKVKIKESKRKNDKIRKKN